MDIEARTAEIWRRSRARGRTPSECSRRKPIVGGAGLHRRERAASSALGMMIRAGPTRPRHKRKLLVAAVEHARESGAKVELEVWPDNARAIALYASAGFEVEGVRRSHYRRRDGSLQLGAAHGAALTWGGARDARPELLHRVVRGGYGRPNKRLICCLGRTARAWPLRGQLVAARDGSAISALPDAVGSAREQGGMKWLLSPRPMRWRMPYDGAGGIGADPALRRGRFGRRRAPGRIAGDPQGASSP